MKSISNNTMLNALYRLGYKGRMTGHGIRTVASTILNENRFSPDAIERQLAHIDAKHIRAYDQGDRLETRRDVMQGWADYLDGLRSKANVSNIKAVT